jgi:hypothetical protein
MIIDAAYVGLIVWLVERLGRFIWDVMVLSFVLFVGELAVNWNPNFAEGVL